MNDKHLEAGEPR